MDCLKRTLAASSLALAIGLALGLQGLARAQTVKKSDTAKAAAETDQGKDAPENVFILPDRLALQHLSKAETFLNEARYSEAIESLDKVLESAEDAFFQPDKDAPTNRRSLKAEAQRLIGLMPAKGLELYQVKFGKEAANQLAAAKRSGDADALALVSRRFFHTQAGREAAFLLGLSHFDHARPLAAALTFQRLRDDTLGHEAFEPALSLMLASCWLQSGMPAKARNLLESLKEVYGAAPLSFGGRQTRWFDNPEDSPRWLQDLIGPRQPLAPAEAESWAMFRGDPSRNAAVQGGAPLLNRLWEIPPTSDNPIVDELIRRFQQEYAEADLTVLPGFHPLAVGDTVLMRTPRKLLAVDFTTGRRLWESSEGSLDRDLDAVLETLPAELLQRQSPQIALGLWQRMWADSTYGTLSSDGRLVFAVEDVPLLSGIAQQRLMLGGARVQSGSSGTYNRLAAYDLHTGKIAWNLGGPADKYALPEAETFFLGPPLPLMGQLYVLAERKGQGEIVLLALDARKGKVLWSQPLVLTEKDVLDESVRHASGISPSYADGILICPTSVGAVVAVDLAGRSLLWGYSYQRNVISSRNAILQGGIVLQGVLNGSTSSQQRRWTDGVATIAHGRVLITPTDSDSLHCLNLADGKLLWNSDRQEKDREDLYLACMHQDKAVLVGRRGVRAVSLSATSKETKTVNVTEIANNRITNVPKKITYDRPQPAWEGRTVSLPEGSAPSGRGFLSGDMYYLPLSSAQIAAIDLRAGSIVQVSKSREGAVPGNLVCHQGKVISQGFAGVEEFYQINALRAEVDRRQAANPNDAEVLSLRAEMLLDEGKLAEAIECFRRAYQLTGDPAKATRTRGLLRETLLEGLQTNFREYRNRSEEIEKLLDDPAQAAAYCRIMAEGLQRSGELLAAFRQYEKLIDKDYARGELDLVEPNHSVRRDRWIQARLTDLRTEASGPAAAAIDQAVTARLQAALQSGKIEPLRRFLDYFGAGAIAATARKELLRRLAAADRLLEAEMLLWPDYQSSDPAVAAPATAQLAEMLRKAHRDEDAAKCYERLAKDFTATICLDGKTGKQLVEGLPVDNPARRLLPIDRRWPVGAVDVETRDSTAGRSMTYRRTDLKITNNTRPFYYESQLQLDQERRAILCRDGWGRETWRLPLPDSFLPSAPSDLLSSVSQSSIHGHLLLSSIGGTLFAIDMINSGNDGSARLLWSQDLALVGINSANLDDLLQLGLPLNAVLSDAGDFLDPYGRKFFGPITNNSYVCFQKNHNLIAVDAISGETIWSRQGVPSGCYLFGDEEYVFTLPPDKTEAFVYRATDGQLLGKRAIPLGDNPSNPDAASASAIIRATNTAGRQKLNSFPQVCLGTLGRNLILWRKQADKYALALFDPWENRPLWPEKTFSSSMDIFSPWLLRDEEILIKNTQGEFTLVGLSDGRTIIDAKFGGGGIGRITGWYEDRYMDNYVVAAIPANSSRSGENIVPLPGGIWVPMRPGLIWAFDKQGKPLWPEPVKIQNQYLLDNQPLNLPVLMFACQEVVSDGIPTLGGIARRNLTSIMCLDKRTGRIVYPVNEKEGRFPNTANSIAIVGDPNQHTMELRMPQQTVRMAFTDKPLPPMPAGGATTQSSSSKTTNALLRAAENLLRGLPQSALPEPAQPPLQGEPKPLPVPEPKTAPGQSSLKVEPGPITIDGAEEDPFGDLLDEGPPEGDIPDVTNLLHAKQSFSAIISG
jgi:outer membrane protein assembly factor BamB